MTGLQRLRETRGKREKDGKTDGKNEKEENIYQKQRGGARNEAWERKQTEVSLEKLLFKTRKKETVKDPTVVEGMQSFKPEF